MTLVHVRDPHVPPEHTGVAPEHAAAFCHVPLVLHVCGWVFEAHCVCPGPHTPVQEPETHVWFTQADAFCQLPLDKQVCGWVLDEHCIAPGLQATQPPFRHAGVLPMHPDVVDS
jgi:hypothetical protein